MTTETLDLRISAVTREAADVIAIRLEHHEGRRLPRWEAGAHVEFFLPSGRIRHYSLCGDPNESMGYTVAVLREAAGRGGSQELHDIARPGLPLRVSVPRNRFPLEPASSYLFIAGGIGITPLLPMMRVAAAAGTPWHLIYGGRTASAMAFAQELHEWKPAQVSLYMDDGNGRPDLAQALKGLPDTVKVYACGPEPMLDVVGRLMQETLCEASLHTERFSAPQNAIDRGGESFDVELARSGAMISIGPAETILDAVRAVSPTVPFSCEEGYCGTCETPVLDGVPDHRDSYLTEDERASNDTILICVSRSRSARLVLDL